MVLIKKTLSVGLTGGIGAGKTVVADLFAQMGVPIIDADIIARELTEKDKEAYTEIVLHFGSIILNEDQSINRKKLRDVIFKNVNDKKWLEALLHPLIRAQMQSLIKTVSAPYCICIIPLLAESTGIDFLDRILVIDAIMDLQIARAANRDNVSKNSIENIIHSQASQQHRLKIANDIIVNNEDLESLKHKVLMMHKKYISLSG